jgi:hypothetical protein
MPPPLSPGCGAQECCPRSGGPHEDGSPISLPLCHQPPHSKLWRPAPDSPLTESLVVHTIAHTVLTVKLSHKLKAVVFQYSPYHPPSKSASGRDRRHSLRAGGVPSRTVIGLMETGISCFRRLVVCTLTAGMACGKKSTCRFFAEKTSDLYATPCQNGTRMPKI